MLVQEEKPIAIAHVGLSRDIPGENETIAQTQLSDILRFSNFGSEAPVPVGSRQGIAGYGAYDMAGNVKEWCWNATGDGKQRYILGGA